MEQTLFWLVESSRDDPTTVALLKGRYREVEEPVMKLVAKVTAREVKLSDVLTVVLRPETNVEQVEKKLEEFEQECSSVEPVSAKYDVAMAVQEKHKVKECENAKFQLLCLIGVIKLQMPMSVITFPCKKTQFIEMSENLCR